MLTDKEKEFCELFINGDIQFIGNPGAIYASIFNVPLREAKKKCAQLLKRKEIQEYLDDLRMDVGSIQDSLKLRITENLLHIMDECRTLKTKDRRGNEMSPAALRTVAITAARELKDMWGVAEQKESKLTIDSDGGGVVFNIIAPQKEAEVTV